MTIDFTELVYTFLASFQALSFYAGITLILYRWKISLDKRRIAEGSMILSQTLRNSIISLVSFLLWILFAVPIIRILFFFFDFLNRLI